MSEDEIFVEQMLDLVDVRMAYGEPVTSLDREAAAQLVAAVRADERRVVARELRDEATTQSSWLWFELGESALNKVAAYIVPGSDTPE